jgi:hypothetical protein
MASTKSKKETEMKARHFIFVTLLFGLTLAACGGGGDGDKPVAVVEKVVKAMETMDVEKASQYFCKDKQDELTQTLESGFEELEQMGMDPDELLAAFKLNMTDMKYEEKSVDGDKAVVGVSGNMSLDFDTDKLKEFFRKAAEAAGQEVTDEQLDMMMGMFTAMGGQEAPVEGDVELIKEDGKWVVCDELDFLNEVDLGF